MSTLNHRQQKMLSGETSMEEIYRTIVNGNLTVKNVPHLYKNGELFADGEDVILDGAVVYNLAKIFKYMLSKGITDSDYCLIKDIA